MLAVSPHFHGQFATCGEWRQGCLPWIYIFERKSKWIVYREHKDLTDIDLKGGDWIDVTRGQGWMMGFCVIYTNEPSGPV
jgi:hypothetical protein